MKSQTRDEYLQENFSEEEIAEIKESARIEAESLLTIQKQISKAVDTCVTEEEKMKMQLDCLAEMAAIGQEIESDNA